jgi:hypothetical protein
MLEEIIVVSSWSFGAGSERVPSHSIDYFQQGNEDPRTIYVTMGRSLIIGDLKRYANIFLKLFYCRGIPRSPLLTLYQKITKLCTNYIQVNTENYKMEISQEYKLQQQKFSPYASAR